eukprot:6195398-Pleurochrysis_carterae.AAC.2
MKTRLQRRRAAAKTRTVMTRAGSKVKMSTVASISRLKKGDALMTCNAKTRANGMWCKGKLSAALPIPVDRCKGKTSEDACRGGDVDRQDTFSSEDTRHEDACGGEDVYSEDVYRCQDVRCVEVWGGCENTPLEDESGSEDAQSDDASRLKSKDAYSCEYKQIEEGGRSDDMQCVDACQRVEVQREDACCPADTRRDEQREDEYCYADGCGQDACPGEDAQCEVARCYVYTRCEEVHRDDEGSYEGGSKEEKHGSEDESKEYTNHRIPRTHDTQTRTVGRTRT